MVEMAWESARKQAAEILDSYWDGETFPVPIIAISNRLGVKSFMAPLPDRMSGMIIDVNGDARAYADCSESGVRRRFTFAHELGHFIERTQVAEDKTFSFEDHRDPDHYDLHEFYADEFAGSLLMPVEDIKRQREDGKSVYDMAKRYGVSLPAMKKRLKRLEKTKTI